MFLCARRYYTHRYVIVVFMANQTTIMQKAKSIKHRLSHHKFSQTSGHELPTTATTITAVSTKITTITTKVVKNANFF